MMTTLLSRAAQTDHRLWCGIAVLVALGTLQADAAPKVTRVTPNVNTGGGTVILSTSLHLPVDVDVAPGVDDYYFVSQLGGYTSDGSDGDNITKRDGRVILVHRETGAVDYNNPFLAISDTSVDDPFGYPVPEVGLFSTTFHPDFANNGKLYVGVAVDYPFGQTPDLSPRDSRTPPFKLSIREYIADPNNIAAGASLSKTILEIDQPEGNHNGSWLGFNPVEAADGKNYLYVTVGDGGGQHDTRQYGQDTESLLGTVLRVDIDNDAFPGDSVNNYAIPGDNPFVGGAGRDEIWAYGLRNPWRAGFDRETGDLYIGDVGQGTWEEINFLAGDILPTDDRNFGWRLREGFIAKPNGPGGGAAPPDNVDPIIAYAHGAHPNYDLYEGNSVTGGIVYRGPIKELRGMYIFADAYSNSIWGIDVADIDDFDPANPGVTLVQLTGVLAPPDAPRYGGIVGFGEDEDGNLLIVENGYDPANIGGNIYRVEVGLPGDYNSDGAVDTIDYAVWREAMQSGARLPDNEDHTIGVTDMGDFEVWLANYTGRPFHFAPLEAPAPSAVSLLLGVVAAGAVGRRRGDR